MKEFLYQIKAKQEGDGGIMGRWIWPPLYTDKVMAPDRKTAKALIEEEYGRAFPTRVLAKDLESNEFLLSIKEIAPDDHRTRRLFEVQTCKRCSKQFKVVEKYRFDGPGGGETHCSYACSRADHEEKWMADQELFSNNPPVIYRITNTKTGMCYIGKTRQVFTLRWYQHFFQTSDTKFHRTIKEYPLTDWKFEIVEVVAVPAEFKQQSEIDAFVSQREIEWITTMDSVRNGYNTIGPADNSGDLF